MENLCCSNMVFAILRISLFVSLAFLCFIQWHSISHWFLLSTKWVWELSWTITRSPMTFAPRAPNQLQHLRAEHMLAVRWHLHPLATGGQLVVCTDVHYFALLLLFSSILCCCSIVFIDYSRFSTAFLFLTIFYGFPLQRHLIILRSARPRHAIAWVLLAQGAPGEDCRPT